MKGSNNCGLPATMPATLGVVEGVTVTVPDSPSPPWPFPYSQALHLSHSLGARQADSLQVLLPHAVILPPHQLRLGQPCTANLLQVAQEGGHRNHQGTHRVPRTCGTNNTRSTGSKDQESVHLDAHMLAPSPPLGLCPRRLP